MVIENWIYNQNIYAFVSILADLFNCKLDDNDLVAIKYGTNESDYHNSHWFDYEINKISISFAKETESNNVFIKVTADKYMEKLYEKINFLFEICQYYSVKDTNTQSFFDEL